ncbi:MAG: hypothetical protein AABY00_00970 [Nanoarchaeota archaeon]
MTVIEPLDGHIAVALQSSASAQFKTQIPSTPLAERISQKYRTGPAIDATTGDLIPA